MHALGERFLLARSDMRSDHRGQVSANARSIAQMHRCVCTSAVSPMLPPPTVPPPWGIGGIPQMHSPIRLSELSVSGLPVSGSCQTAAFQTDLRACILRACACVRARACLPPTDANRPSPT